MIKDRGFSFKILFAIQTFSWDSFGYEMPSAQELGGFASQVVQKDIAGIVWYSWGRYLYSSSLAGAQWDDAGNNRWEVVRSTRFFQ